MAVAGAQATIMAALTAWPGVMAKAHRFGGIEFVLGVSREIGHIHGDQLVDLPLPKRLRDEAVAAGRAQPHHIFPGTGWVSIFLNTPDDVAQAIELFQLSYEVAARQQGARNEPGSAG